MAVVRINKTADYTVMSNAHFKEKEMSLKAKGLLSLMLSLPDNWDYSINGLVTLSKDGKDSVMGALNELEEFGYLVRTKLIDKNGRFIGYDYDIFEIPNTEKPYAEKPNTEKPNTEKPLQLNTNKSNTKKSTTNELNTELIKDIITYLNEKVGTNYKYKSSKTQTLINNRLKEDYTFEDFKIVIDKKYNDWKGTEWEKYLRPETLFGTKFESYLNQKEITKQPVENKQEMSEADSLRSKGYNPGFCDWLESVTL